AAFEQIPTATMSSLIANPTGELTTILKYHVISGRLSPDQLAGQHTTLEGASLTVTGSGTSFKVNGSANVVCGNVQTANATVYIVDSVLQPFTTDFGPACSSVPTSGAGSFTGMTQDPVATAASNNPVLSTLVTAVTKAGLGDTLNSAPALTVFAPDNSAFAKVPAATLNSLLATPQGMLTAILKYHVISGRLSPDQLDGTHATLGGGTLTVSGGAVLGFTVNASTPSAALVVCGNVQTANATVYIIDTVLSPPAAPTASPS
ncbi:MAG TPA: fasciclin domain-containing protein, partial [Actinomycetota bacterium]|nr:fasciclin domain-containing protein [Actinomycetota bacterium]